MLSLTIERTGRGDEIHVHPAGQGVWVARMAGEMGALPVLCGFVGGETGTTVRPLLERLPVELRLVAPQAPRVSDYAWPQTDEGEPMSLGAGRDGPVLLAYDGSDHAKSAIEQAARLLGTTRETLVLTVWQPLQSVPFFGGAALPTIPTEVREAGAREAEAVAAEGAELASAAGFDAEPVVDEGAPVWHRIIAVADARDAAVVVLGSHGRSGLSYAPLGSVATSVGHHTDRPALITRLTRHGA